MQGAIRVAAFDAILACGDVSWSGWLTAHWHEFLGIVFFLLSCMVLFRVTALYSIRFAIRHGSRVLLRRSPLAVGASAEPPQ